MITIHPHAARCANRCIKLKNNSLLLLFDKYTDKIPIFFNEYLMGATILPNSWRTALALELPGIEAQQQMAPTFRGTFHHAAPPVRAAVMVLMYPSHGEICIVLIKRNEYEGPHSGQVSLPGGAEEKDDGSIEETALRETKEELGIREGIEVLGSMTPLHIPVSNFQVFPVVGWVAARPMFQPDPGEVQYLIECPVGTLLNPDNRDSETIFRHGRSIIAPFYKVGEEKIWGATAMMLCEYLQLASRLL
jgi:8-oxo-dGTP pyrophosphatase MutT (NUDIX family)